jgi:GTPase SAR1 family protein
MGACFSHKTHPAGSVSTTLQRDIDKRIEDNLRADQDEERKVIKCLLLGAGECGKSTILKQMKILHLDGFKSPDEKAAYKALVWKNTLESMHTICTACDTLKISYESAKNQESAQRLLALSVNDSPLEVKQDILALWQDGGVQKAVARASEFHLLDSAPYFLEAAERILVPSYEPTTQDILRSRIATTGIIETEFLIDKLLFRMYDVGGQRGERKKWIHCFENVTAIMFIASLSEYDQVLAEDRTR